MALPLIAAQLVNVLYNIVDRIYIGHIEGIGSMALTGVGIALPVITILSAFAGLFGQGGAPLCSIARGEGDLDTAERIMGNSMTLLLSSSILLTVITGLLQKPILYALGATEATVDYAYSYLNIYLIGTPFVFVTLGMNLYINSQGFARRGMLTVMLGALANIALDPLFIFAFKMGVAGAALATVLSQGLSAAWCLSFLCGKKAILNVRWSKMGLRGRIVKKILSLGISNFVMMGTNSVIQAVANKELGLYGGDLYVGAMTIVNSLRTVFNEVIHGLSQGLQPVLGYNYGAGAKKRVLEGIRFGAFCGLGIAAAVFVAFFIFPETFVRIFTEDRELISVAIPSVRIYFCGSIFMVLQFAAQSVFQGLGRAKYAITFSLLRKIIIVVPLMILLPRWGLGASGVFWSEPISDVIGGGAAFTTMLLTVYRPIARELKKEEATL